MYDEGMRYLLLKKVMRELLSSSGEYRKTLNSFNLSKKPRNADGYYY